MIVYQPLGVNTDYQLIIYIFQTGTVKSDRRCSHSDPAGIRESLVYFEVA